jgi:hypothetical protein
MNKPTFDAMLAQYEVKETGKNLVEIDQMLNKSLTKDGNNYILKFVDNERFSAWFPMNVYAGKITTSSNVIEYTTKKGSAPFGQFKYSDGTY